MSRIPAEIFRVCLEFGPDHRESYGRVLRDLRGATHCLSCGKVAHVSLVGYVGRYCTKQCWLESSSDEEEEEEPWPISRAVSRYHQAWFNLNSPTSIYWPMAPRVRCENECIRLRQPVDVGREAT